MDLFEKGYSVEPEWTTLARRAQRGDRDAFSELYRLMERPVYGFLRRMVHSAEDARDLTQETFIEGWRRLSTLQDPGAFRAWLFRIALNKARDALKRHSPPTQSLDATLGDAAPLEPADPAPGALARMVSEERREQVQDAIETLPPDQRAVILLFYTAETPVDEIARVLSLPKGTVVSRLSRARERLRRKLSATVEV